MKWWRFLILQYKFGNGNSDTRGFNAVLVLGLGDKDAMWNTVWTHLIICRAQIILDNRPTIDKSHHTQDHLESRNPQSKYQVNPQLKYPINCWVINHRSFTHQSLFSMMVSLLSSCSVVPMLVNPQRFMSIYGKLIHTSIKAKQSWSLDSRFNVFKILCGRAVIFHYSLWLKS